VSTVLDPNYGFRWCPKEERLKWRQALVSFIEQEDGNFGLPDLSSVQNKEYSPPKWSIEYKDEADDLEKANLINHFIDKYLSLANDYNYDYLNNKKSSDLVVPFVDVPTFWKKYSNDLSVLSKIARKVLAVPATSAAVERFFSKTGYIMRPHWRKIKDHLACKFYIIKANGRLLDLD
jgi:hypothetical protein